MRDHAMPRKEKAKNMGNTPSVEQQAVWALLPDVALERVFANMEVTTVLRVLENTTNEHVAHIAASNVVWKKRYEQLYMQDDIKLFLITVRNRLPMDLHDEWMQLEMHGLLNYLPAVSLEACHDLIRHMEGELQNPVRPHAYYFLHFLLIWCAVPHVWWWQRDQDKTVSDVHYWAVVKLSTGGGLQTLSPGDLKNDELYLNWRSRIRIVPRCTWIEVIPQTVAPGQYVENQIRIRHSDVPLCVEMELYQDQNQIQGEPKLLNVQKYGDCETRYGPMVRLQSFTRRQNLLMNVPDSRVELWGGRFFRSTALIPYLVIGIQPNGSVQFQAVAGLEESSEHWTSTLGRDPSNMLLPWMHEKRQSPGTLDLMGCAVCATPSKQTCGHCQKVLYCSQDCQRADWFAGGHDEACRRPH